MITRSMFWIALVSIASAAAPSGLSALQEINRVTCDGSACPRPLELGNGRRVTIGLTGRGLDALASGLVTDRSGRRIDGVTVELAPLGRQIRRRTSTVTREVTVTAQDAASHTGLQLRFTTSAQGAVTAPLELSVAAAPQPGITRVSDDDVQVKPGGAAVALTVEGVDLSAVTSARLLLDGRPVRGLVATLGTTTRSNPGGAGGQLDIELAAGASVQSGNYQLELTAGRQRLVVPGTISVVDVTANTPSVTAAIPSSVELRAGGDPQIVTLTGSNLDKATAAHVERDGWEMGAVTAVLRAPTDPTSREVILTAKTGAGPPWEVPLDLVLQSGAGSTEVPLQLLATAQPTTLTVTAHILIATPPLRMTGLRLPIEVQTQTLRMTGLRLPIRVTTQGLQMTGIREEGS